MSATNANDEIGRLRLRLRAFVIVVGILEAWTLRYHIFSDGIQYLEIAQKYGRGEWSAAVNAYWSPLYSWVLALAFTVLKPAAYWQAPILHLVNLLAYVVSLLTFEYFLSRLIASSPGLGTQKGWLFLAYLLFLWGGVELIRNAYPSPDMIVAAWVYLLQGMLIAMAQGKRTFLFFAGFGAVLGLAYLTKAAFFGIAPAYLLAAALLLRRLSVAIQRIGVALVALLAVAAPFLIALHQQKGYWTIGEAGKLNYSWEVREAPRSTHWQGGPGDLGTPEHPTRRIITSPDVYEFATPIEAAYPPWFDPSYWYAGIHPHFAIGPQARAIVSNSVPALFTFLFMPGMLPYLVLAGVLWKKRNREARARPDGWLLLLPAAAGILLYLLVFVETRYIAAFLVVISATTFAELGVRDGFRSRFSRYAPHVGVVTAGCVLLPVIFYFTLSTLNECVNRHERDVNAQALIAQEMSAFGVRPGDKIAYVGLGIDADWVRLLKARIVAEITVTYERKNDIYHMLRLNDAEVEKFWRMDAAGQDGVFRSFAKAGATVVVADVVPEWVSPVGWLRLRTLNRNLIGTDFVYARKLE